MEGKRGKKIIKWLTIRVNQNNYKVAAECIAIKYLIDEVTFDISVIKVYAKKNIKDSFQQNREVHIAQKCDKEARRIYKNKDERIDKYNIRY